MYVVSFRQRITGRKIFEMTVRVTLVVLICILPANSIYSSMFTFSPPGYEFQPDFNNQLMLSITVRSRLLCAAECNERVSCRTFDYDPMRRRCRLLEADLTTGSIIFSASPHSVVGYAVLSMSLYVPIHDESCSACQENRYQICSLNTSTCQCPPRTFWNGTICLLQLFPSATCTQIDACRMDLDLSCAKDVNNTFTRCSPGNLR